MINEQVKVSLKDGFIFIEAPFTNEFYKEIKQLKTAKWDNDKDAWKVNEAESEKVKEITQKYYGIPGETLVDVQFTFLKEYNHDDKQDFSPFFQTAIRLKSRDEFQLKPGTSFKKGSVSSAGSVKYPNLRFEKDSILILTFIPESLAKNYEVPQDKKDFFKFEIIEKSNHLIENGQKVAKVIPFVVDVEKPNKQTEMEKRVNEELKQKALQNTQTTHTNNENVCILTIQQQQQLIELLNNPKSNNNNNTIIESKENTTVLDFDIKKELKRYDSISFGEKGRYNIYVSSENMEKAKEKAKKLGLNVSNLIDNFFNILDKLL